MRLVSVNVGKPREIGILRGRPVESGIYKDPVNGPLRVRKLNLDGDAQADLTVHGGQDKAVYVYPSEHYDYWMRKFPDREMSWGTFGENLTTKGLFEEQVRLGDRLVINSAELEVTQPRFPCYKLGIKFGTQMMLRWFLDSEKSGFYLRVLKEGSIEAGDEIKLVSTDKNSETIASIVRGVKRQQKSTYE